MNQETTISTLEKELKDARSRIQRFIRESEIQAALETVRAASLAMRHTSELQHVINAVGTQFKSLEIDNTGGVFVIINESIDKELSVWGSGDTAAYQNKVHIPYLDRPIYTNLINLVKKGPGLSTETYSNEEKQEFFRHMFEIPPYNQTSKEHQRNWLAREGGYTRTVAVSLHTTLFMINHHGRVFSDEENQILSRFGAVFEQSYIRFLDLQKAEKQARESQIEAALERVRAASMAMHRSDQLIDVSNVMYDELRNLGIDQFAQCGFVLINEEKAEQYVWGSSEADNKLMAYYVLPLFGDQVFEDRYRTWKEGKTFYTQILNSGQLKDHIEVAMPENRITDRERDAKRDMPETTYFYFGNFSSGYLQVISGVPLTPEFEPIFKRFTRVFEQSYTRFLDLKKAEGQAREAKIEAALERVRSRSLAMHQSDELREVVSVLYQEVGKLGLADWGCNLQIFDPSEKTIQIWLSEDENQIHPKSYFFRDAGHPHIEMQWHKWEQKETYFTISLSGSDKKSYDDYVLNYTDFRHFPDEIKANIRSLDQIYFNFAWMQYGFLVGISVERPMEDPEFETLGRFANVFEQTYTRFYDIQKAEAQAREARIEAALERVRAASMAMHRSEDLSTVALTFFQQIERLEIPINAASINLVNESTESYRLYFANRHDIGITAELDIRDFWFATESFRRLQKGEKEFTKICEGDNLKAWIDYIKRDISKERGVQLEEMNPSKSYIHSVQFHELSHTIFTSISPLSQSVLTVLKRMTQAFGMSYIRFLDLQKAEEQAREAQIEAALERIRARTMAMHTSDEFRETIGILFDQLNLLDFDIQQCSLTIISEREDEAESWQSATTQSILPRSFKMRFPDDPYFRKNIRETLLKKEGYSVITFEGEDKKQFDAYIFENTPVRHAPEEVIDFMKSHKKIVLCRAYMRYGFIETVSNTSKLNPDKEAILQRFSKVLEQTYTRFLDLKKAEAQAREAQIEAALEKIRSGAMAMHTSDDLFNVVSVLRQQMHDLGQKDLESTLIHLYHDDVDYFDAFWSYRSTGRSDADIITGIAKVPLDNDWAQACLENYHSEKVSYLIYSERAMLHEWYQVLEQIAPQTLEYDIEGRIIVPERLYYYLSKFKGGALMMITEEEAGNDAIDLQQRAAKVFGLAYQRYIDLKIAEEQTREAQIETALERVRTRSLAMHKSEELADLSLELVKQVQALGIETWFCAFNIYDDDPQGSLEWGSNGVGTFPKYRTPREGIFLKYFEAGQKGETLLVNEIGEDVCPAHYEYLCSLPGVGDQLLQMQREGIPFPTSQVDHVAYFQYGYLIFITYQPIPESFHIFKRFAKVFEQSYTRFLDLKKAEAQAREAQVEAALERVRAQTMAMQSSHDIGASVTSLFESLIDLGISEKVRCGIGILNYDDTNMDLWTASSSPESEVILNTGQIDMSQHPLLTGARNSWKNQERHFGYTLKGEDLIRYHHVINQSARYPTKIDIDTLPEEINHDSFVFDHGLLYAFADTPLPKDVVQILERLSIVFEHTYTRFLDLQQAELREKEAIKQASLDRIRAETASMRTASDLDQIIPLIWRELITLKVPFIRCGVFIMDESEKVIHNYLSTPEGEAIASFVLPFETPGTISQILNHWRRKEMFLDYWDQESMIAFSNVLVDNGIFSDPKDYLETLPQQGFHLHFLPFIQGMLYVGNTSPLDSDQIDLLQGVSNAFSTAYARFEDFKKLEMAKEQVDQALQNLKDAQQQLIHAEKMASLGELTAGIAHEIQNPLNFVNNFSEIGVELIVEIQEELQNNDLTTAKEILSELIQNLQKIHHHGERASGIVRGMLDHSRAKSDEKSLTDINQLCDEYLRLAYHGLRAKNKSFQANFRLEADPDLPKVLVASQDIGRVLLNLINNGFQATLEKSKTYSLDYRPELALKTVGLEDSIQIHVIDNGPGISKETQEKIFQPFFTTKPTGVGTGLGLSLAYDIIKAHGGKIMVESIPGEGTNFIVSLPMQQKNGVITPASPN